MSNRRSGVFLCYATNYCFGIVILFLIFLLLRFSQANTYIESNQYHVIL